MECRFGIKALVVSMMAAGMLMVSAGAQAGATLINSGGTVALGVNDDGSLNTTDGGVAVNGGVPNATGIAYKFPDGNFYDATSPGCLCEGWGVSVNGTDSGYANVSTDYGANNLTYGALTGVTGTTATSTASIASLPGITVTQSYQQSANAPGAMFVDHVTITNTTGAAVSDLNYVRVMDWDIPPTEFNEFVTIQGTATTSYLAESGDNGFNTANPLGGYYNYDPACSNQDCYVSGPNDHGAYFRFNFGSLADGESQVFDIFYGAAANQTDAFAAINAEGLELFSLGYSNYYGTPGYNSPTFIFGFKGVGGVVTPPSPVPEPETYAMLLAGLGLLVFTARRKEGLKLV